MKSITPTLSGLASSLFLNVGLTGFAEKLDPVTGTKSELIRKGEGLASGTCVVPCAFPDRSR